MRARLSGTIVVDGLTSPKRIVCARAAGALIWINPWRLRAMQYVFHTEHHAKNSCPDGRITQQITAVKQVIALSKMGADVEVHLLQVQPPLVPGNIPDIAKPSLVEPLGLD